ncbi:MAG: hypothetical protein QXT84_03765 [Candidatus Bathyarchaeia archaeon]
MSYVSVEFVKALAQIKYADLGFNSEDAFNSFISELIDCASSLINDYCNQSFNEPVPPAVSYAAALIVVNMLHEMLQRKINPIQTQTNVVVKLVESEAFTDKIKRLLDPYRVLRVERG